MPNRSRRPVVTRPATTAPRDVARSAGWNVVASRDPRPSAPGRTPGSEVHGGPGSCCLDRRRQRADVVSALVPAAVDEEGRGATDGGDVGALDVTVDPCRVSAFDEVAGEPLHVQAELVCVADEV